MNIVDKGPYEKGVHKISKCFFFIPSKVAENYYYYPTWIGHFFCNSKYFHKRDSYPNLLLVYVRDGQFKLNYRFRNYKIKKGQLFIIDCREPHYYAADENLEFIYLHFDGANSHGLIHHIINNHGVIIEGDKAVSIGADLYNLIELVKEKEISSEKFSLEIYSLLLKLNISSRSKKEPNENPIYSVIEFINNNLNKNLNIDLLAEKANLSKYYFARQFKLLTGYPPKDFIINKRINKAKELLETSVMNISEISISVGYENVSSFGDMFNKKVGLTPSAFRKQMY